MAKIACIRCGVLIMIETAAKTQGQCIPCAKGYRKDIEASRKRIAKEREDRDSPDHRYWLWLVEQVCGAAGGLGKLPKVHQQFFAVACLESEIYRGGFDAYFHNSAGDTYAVAMETLVEIGANQAAQILLDAKLLYFGRSNVPVTQEKRWLKMREIDETDPRYSESEELDRAFCKVSDQLHGKLREFQAAHKLIEAFLELQPSQVPTSAS